MNKSQQRIDGPRRARKRVYFALFVLILCLPAVLTCIGLEEWRPLKGDYQLVDKARLSSDNWWTGEFQERVEVNARERGYTRALLTRTYNQCQLWLYGHAGARGVIRGKGHYLFETDYLRASTGQDLVSLETASEKVDRLQEVRDSLLTLGTEVMVMLAPGKGEYYPEFAPVGWEATSDQKTNYTQYAKLLSNTDIPVIDIQKWFGELKDKSSYPLMPITGVHWSEYGEYLVADTLLSFLGHQLDMPTAKVVLDTTLISKTMHGRDNDIELSMNLLYDFPNVEMAYPVYGFLAPVSEAPKVLVIADSFYWGLYNRNFSAIALGGGEFWYYGKEIHPPLTHVTMADIPIRMELARYDAVLFLTSDVNLDQFGFGMIERFHKALNRDNTEKENQEEKIKELIYEIRKDEKWYRQVEVQSAREGISLKTALRNNAIYMRDMRSTTLNE